MKVFKKLGTQLLVFTDGATWKNERKQNSKDWVGRNPGQHTRARSSRELEPTSGAGGSGAGTLCLEGMLPGCVACLPSFLKLVFSSSLKLPMT